MIDCELEQDVLRNIYHLTVNVLVFRRSYIWEVIWSFLDLGISLPQRFSTWIKKFTHHCDVWYPFWVNWPMTQMVARYLNVELNDIHEIYSYYVTFTTLKCRANVWVTVILYWKWVVTLRKNVIYVMEV